MESHSKKLNIFHEQKINKILLTGGTGQIGWELKQLLVPLGEIIAPNRKQFNLVDPESLREKIQHWEPDLIINPAAFTAVDNAEDDPKLAFTINARAPKVIAEEAQKLKIPLIHYSTDYVFDGKKKTPYREEDPPNPINVYGESKLMGEQAIQETTEKYLILRTSWVYSKRGNNFLTTMLKLFQDNHNIKVVNDQIGAPTSARFIAEITTILAKNSKPQNSQLLQGIYHLTAAGSSSWYGFAKEIQNQLNSGKKATIIPVSSKEYPTKALRPSMSLLENKKIISNMKLSFLPLWKDMLGLEL